MENLPIDLETVNKTIDIVNESTKETRKEIDKNAAKGINKLSQLIWASPLGRVVDIYIAERPYKMEKALEEMKQKYETIPEKYRVEPSSYIALKGVNELNYSLEEEHLKDMFQNLLVSDMDLRKKGKVLPSYIEIIKQLSKDDAEFLKFLYTHKGRMCSINLKLKRSELKGHSDLDKYVIYNYIKTSNSEHFSTLKLNPLVIDTLLMHRLIEVDYTSYFTYPSAEDEYSRLFDSVKKQYKLGPDMNLSFDKGMVRLTELGKNFVDICIS